MDTKLLKSILSSIYIKDVCDSVKITCKDGMSEFEYVANGVEYVGKITLLQNILSESGEYISTVFHNIGKIKSAVDSIPGNEVSISIEGDSVIVTDGILRSSHILGDSSAFRQIPSVKEEIISDNPVVVVFTRDIIKRMSRILTQNKLLKYVYIDVPDTFSGAVILRFSAELGDADGVSMTVSAATNLGDPPSFSGIFKFKASLFKSLLNNFGECLLVIHSELYCEMVHEHEISGVGMSGECGLVCEN